MLLLTGWISAADANTTTWSGASGSDINWSDAANWNPNAPALTGTDIVFANTGAAAIGTVTSIVDSSQTIDSLIFNNVGGSAAAQTLQLNNGVVLADTGAISTAFNSGVATGGAVYDVINGPGSLNVNGGTASADFYVGIFASTVTGTATLDMSGLSTFSATVNTFGVGDASSTNTTPQVGMVLLAGTNSITAATLAVSDSPDASSGGSELLLGAVNTIDSNTIIVGGGKGNDVNSFLEFNTGLTNPTVTIANEAGTGGASLQVGVNGVITSITQTAVVDFSAGTVSGSFSSIVVGGNGISSNSGVGVGTLIMGSGTITATTIISGTGANTVSSNTSVGTITMDGPGTLNATTVYLTADASDANASSIFNQNGGATNFTTVILGQNSGARSESANYLLTSGTANITTLNLGTEGGTGGTMTANVNQSGGVANITTMTIGTRTNSTLNATYALSSGTLNAETIQAGSGTATRSFNWTGGTIGNLPGNNLTIGAGITVTITSTNSFIAANGQSITVNSGMGGAGGFTATGPGTLVVSNTNTYGGTTNVAGGTVVVQGTLSNTSAVNASAGTLEIDGAVNPAAVVSATGATLQGTGSVGADELNGGATFDPGAKTTGVVAGGLLATTGVTFLDTASILSITIGDSSDTDTTSFSATGGTVTLDHTPLNLDLGAAFIADAPAADTLYQIITGGASATGSGSDLLDFDGIDLVGATPDDGGLASQPFVDDGSVFDVVYNAGGAGNVAVQYVGTASVPEPGTWGMLLGGIAMLIAFRRRIRA